MKKNTFGSYSENRHTDDFEEIIDIDTGELVRKKEPKRQVAINTIKDYFSDQCYKAIRIRPVMTTKENIIIGKLFNQGMKPSEMYDVIDWWFDTQSDKGKLIHLSMCLSSYSINSHKAFKA